MRSFARDCSDDAATMHAAKTSPNASDKQKTPATSSNYGNNAMSGLRHSAVQAANSRCGFWPISRWKSGGSSGHVNKQRSCTSRMFADVRDIAGQSIRQLGLITLYSKYLVSRDKTFLNNQLWGARFQVQTRISPSNSATANEEWGCRLNGCFPSKKLAVCCCFCWVSQLLAPAEHQDRRSSHQQKSSIAASALMPTLLRKKKARCS